MTKHSTVESVSKTNEYFAGSEGFGFIATVSFLTLKGTRIGAESLTGGEY